MINRNRARRAIAESFGAIETSTPGIWYFPAGWDALDACKDVLDTFDPGMTGQGFGVLRLMIAEPVPDTAPTSTEPDWPIAPPDDRPATEREDMEAVVEHILTLVDGIARWLICLDVSTSTASQLLSAVYTEVAGPLSERIKEATA